jgi:fluoride exporter
MTTPLLVVLGAAVGAPCRWAVDRAVQARHDSVFPWGTFTINVLGSLALGVLLGATTFAAAPAELVALLGTGFAGAFTTFSTFAFETARLLQEGARLVAVVNVAASVAVGLVAAMAGWYASVAAWA